jgi:hypothetical protein
MGEKLGAVVNEETQIVVRSLNRLRLKGYDDRWIADYLSEKTGQNVKQADIRKNDFTLRNGDSIGWRSFEWTAVK